MKGFRVYYEKLKENSIFIVLSVFTVMIISLCFQDTINYDEFYSLHWSRLGWGDLMRQLKASEHPPLHYLVLKFVFNLTNENMFSARILSAVACISFLWSGSLFLKNNFGKKSALFFVCFLYLNPFMIQKATEIRMYTWASAFCIGSGIMSYYILKTPRRKHWIFFVLFSLLAAYTHYYALLVMVFLYLGLGIYFLFARNWKEVISWLLCCLATVIGYLAWLPTAWRQVTSVNKGFWISAPSARLGPLRDLFYSVVPYTEHIYTGLIMLLTVAVFASFLWKKKSEYYWASMCASALWGILLFTMWYASRFEPILVSRYLIMALCLLIMGVSVMFRSVNKYIVFALCIFCAVIGGLRYYAALQAQSNRETSRTVAYMEEMISPDDSIAYVKDNYGYFGNCVEYYFNDVNKVVLEEFQIEYLPEIAKKEGTIWFFDSEHYLEAPQIEMQNINLETCGEFGFNDLTFKIYKIEKE